VAFLGPAIYCLALRPGLLLRSEGPLFPTSLLVVVVVRFYIELLLFL